MSNRQAKEENQNEENIKVEKTEYQNDLSHIKNKLSFLFALVSKSFCASYPQLVLPSKMIDHYSFC